MKKSLNIFFQKYLSHFLNVLMIILGCIGLIKNYYHSLYFPKQTIFSIFVLILIGMGFYFYFNKHHKMPKNNGILIFVVLSVLMILIFQNEFYCFISKLQDVIKYDYFLNFDELVSAELLNRGIFYQIVMLWLGLPIVYLIVSLVCTKQYSLIKILGLILLFIFPVFIRHELAIGESYCFIIFICYQFLVKIILQSQQKQYYLKVVVIVFLCFASVIASMFLEQNALFQQPSSSFLSQIVSGKKNPLGLISQTGMSGDIDGTLPTSNIQLNQGLALTVQAEVPFSSYLRAYSLANYRDNEWHEVYEDYPDNRSLTLYSNFIAINYLPSFQAVKIIPNRNYDYQFTPYYLVHQYEAQPLLYDSYLEYSDNSLSVIYHYENDPETNSDPNSYVVDEKYDYDYADYVYRNYMDVPKELGDQLLELLDENEMLSLRFNVELAVEKVRELLASKTRYDLNAGILPDDKDFVEYFLFENRKGSCTHYATAGALLLRKIGIPTRFVKGYTMLQSDFHDGEAKIPQYRAHAWVEVYQDNQGWVPYEMTPSANLEEISNVLDDEVNQNQQTTNTTDLSTTPTEQNTTPDTKNNQAKLQESSQFYQYLKIIGSLAAILALIIIYRYLTTHWLKIKTKQMTNKQKVLVYYHVIWKFSFQHQVDDGKLKNLAYKAKYSLHEITNQEWLEFYRLYQQWIKQYDQSLKWYQKLIFRYIKGYK